MVCDVRPRHTALLKFDVACVDSVVLVMFMILIWMFLIEYNAQISSMIDGVQTSWEAKSNIQDSIYT